MYAMTEVGVADTPGRCLLTSIENSSKVAHREQKPGSSQPVAV